MRIWNAYTTELDEAQAAVSDLLAQLGEGAGPHKNAAAFLTCSYDFVETGMVEAVCEALPFDVIGCTTLANATNGQEGTMVLCLTVLSADDCRFAAVCTDALDTEMELHVEHAVDTARAALGEDPAFILALAPLMASVGGELMVQALDRAAKGAPIFGTVACDFDTAEYSNTFTLYNGKGYRDRMVLLCIAGNVQPRFVVTATSEQNLFKQQAVITKSQGSILQEINGMPAIEYFNSIGLTAGTGVEGLSSVPFVVDYQDGTQPVARAVYGLGEGGAAHCGGVMPTGGTLSIGRMDVKDILLTAKQSIETLTADGAGNGIICFPCLGRNMVLGVDLTAEIEVVKATLPDGAKFHLAYSGGEICPVYNVHGGENGGAANRFHNFTFIACKL